MSQEHYWEALDRLVNACPIRLAKGTIINNDTVALEAGRKRGTIKKSRPSHLKLIEAIKAAKKKDRSQTSKIKRKLLSSESQSKEYRQLYRESLNRELMYILKLSTVSLRDK